VPIILAATLGPALVELRVMSGGSGFPPDRLQEVFGLFERGQAETAVFGMGIGLAICRAIVEAHGGSIRAFNLPEGRCVAFSLPWAIPTIESEALLPEGEGE
jgi:two-component system sensor histidine kinase KdpD